MPTSLAHIHCRMRLDAPVAFRNVAVFAAYLATSCRFCHPPCGFLPLLPPITPNVKFLQAANRLEFGIRGETARDHTMKCGKNGNVHHSSQHCRAPHAPFPTRTARCSRACMPLLPLSLSSPSLLRPLSELCVLCVLCGSIFLRPIGPRACGSVAPSGRMRTLPPAVELVVARIHPIAGGHERTPSHTISADGIIVSNAHVWRAAQERLRRDMTRAQFDTWLRGTWLAAADDGATLLCVRTTFARELLESRFHDRIAAAIAEVNGQPCRLRIVVAAAGAAPTNGTTAAGLFESVGENGDGGDPPASPDANGHATADPRDSRDARAASIPPASQASPPGPGLPGVSG